jgi:hypothetical protein
MSLFWDKVRISSISNDKGKMMNIRRDRKLLRRALAEGIRTAAELALWLKERSTKTPALSVGF